MQIEIDSERIQSEIDELAQISEAPPPVVTRVLFSRANLKARAFIQERCSKLQLAIREDAVGNVFARWNGEQPDLPAVATGSHIDAIPNAGKYDGVVGVLGALEAIRGLQRAGFKPKRSIELVVFTAEEPTRFGIGCLGSRLLSGVLAPEQALQLTDTTGKPLADWLKEVYGQPGDLRSVRLTGTFYSAFVELHIEQGPLLEQQQIDLGVVEQIAAPATLRVELKGEGGHAGAVLMPDRRDALLAGAEIALAVEGAAKESQSPDTVGTTGVFRIEPGAVNSVPYRALLEIDLRDTQLSTRDIALHRIRENISAIAHRRGVQAHLDVINQDAPAICDASLVQASLQTAVRHGFSAKRMISRAYHDSLFMAQICPTTMIFVPCRNGVSHRPDEYASPEAIYKGTLVLAHLLQELASDQTS
jgi:hydantoinase/carbamoylase family amidase